MTEYQDYASPLANAQQIAIAGVPLLRAEQAGNQGTTAAIAAGSSTSVGPFTFNSIAYELRLTLTATALTAICNGQVSLIWKTAGGGTILAQKTFSAAASTGGHVLTVCGPVRGAQLTIQFTNASTSLTTVTFAYNIVNSSRLAFNDLYRTVTGVGSGPPSFATWAGVNMDSGLLMNSNPSVASLGTAVRGCGAYNGPVQLAVSTASGTNDCEVDVQISDTSIAVNYGTVFRAFTDTKGKLNAQIGMPMSECSLSVINNNAGAQTISMIIQTAEPNVN